MIIHPDIFVTPDYPVVRFREPREQIDLAVELPKILHTQGWGLGTYFHIQFVSHDKTRLFCSAPFIVTVEREHFHVANPEGFQPMTKTLGLREAEQIGAWWHAPPVQGAPSVQDVKAESAAPQPRKRPAEMGAADTPQKKPRAGQPGRGSARKTA